MAARARHGQQAQRHYPERAVRPYPMRADLSTDTRSGAGVGIRLCNTALVRRELDRSRLGSHASGQPDVGLDPSWERLWSFGPDMDHKTLWTCSSRQRIRQLFKMRPSRPCASAWRRVGGLFDEVYQVAPSASDRRANTIDSKLRVSRKLYRVGD